MAIILSSNVATVFANPPVTHFHLLRIYDDTSTLKAITSYAGDVTMSDGVTYVADGTLKYADPPSISSTVDRELFRVQLADPSRSLAALAETGLTGKRLELRVAFYSTQSDTLLTNIADTFLVYRGYADGFVYNVDVGEVGEVILELTGTSPMADLDLKKGIYFSKDFVRGRNLKDSAADMVYSGSGALQLKWGRS